MVDRHNLDGFGLKTVNETVASVNDFAQGLVPDFWDHTAGLREQLKSTDRCDEPLSQETCVPLRVASHIGLLAAGLLSLLWFNRIL